MSGETHQQAQAEKLILTKDHFMGQASRWRRFGEPVPAGRSLKPDGSPDFGLFGPGSLVWEVMLHPATVVLEGVAQSVLQLTYKPIAAGIRDHDPLSRKARAGTVTFFDAFERFQRNSGMHAPMWLGDTPSAQKMADHLHRVHTRVAGDIIDIGTPELGGYAASGPRDAMMAAVTELDGILRAYETFAFHGSEPPRKLTPAERDRYWREGASYVRLVGAREDEIPTSAADVEALYDKYDHLFGRTDTIEIIPETGQNFKELSAQVMTSNFHESHMMALKVLQEQFNALRTPMLAALGERALRNAGLTEDEMAGAIQSVRDILPAIREMQSGESEREIMRLLWGPDGVTLIDNARELHANAMQAAADGAKV